jgi:branched-chain amino acid transport system substrate-binding protein
MITPISTNPDVTLVGDYIFRACFIDSVLGEVDATFARDDLKARTAVVITNVSDKYSLGLSEFFERKFAALGGHVIGEREYLDTTTDFTEILATVKQLQPDVVFLPGFYKDSGLLIKQARNLHIDMPFLGGDGWNDEMYQYGGNAINGNYFSSHWDRLSTLPKSRAFVSRFEAQFGTIKTPGTALGYDSAYLLADAIRRAQSSEPAKIRDALAATRNFEGVTGSITFDANRDPVGKPAIMFQFKDGRGVYLKTVAAH